MIKKVRLAVQALCFAEERRLRAQGGPVGGVISRRPGTGCHVQLWSWHAPRGPFFTYIRGIFGVSLDETACWTVAQGWSHRLWCASGQIIPQGTTIDRGVRGHFGQGFRG